MNPTITPIEEPVLGMTAADATAAVNARIAELEALHSPANTAYYPYEALTVGKTTLNTYSGTPTILLKEEAAPENVSIWPVPIAAEGFRYYYNEQSCWVLGIDIKSATLSQLQALATKAVTDTFTEAVDALQGDYTDAERSSWVRQLSEAQGVINGTVKQPVTLSALAAARGVDLRILAQKIVDKDNAYNDEYSSLLATYQKAKDTIQGAKTVDDLPALILKDVSASV